MSFIPFNILGLKPLALRLIAHWPLGQILGGLLISNLLFGGVASGEPKSTSQAQAESETRSARLEQSLAQFLKWFPGEYNNHEQVWLQKGLEEDVVFSHVHHLFAAVQAPQVGAHAFYIEQRMVEKNFLFRQRLYVISLDRERRALRLDIYKFKDEARWRGLHLRAQDASQLSMTDLIPLPGCEVYWSYEAAQDRFLGSMIKDKCRIVSARSKKTMIINDDLILESNAIFIRDVARDEKGKVLFGYPDKPHYRNVKVRYFKGWAVIRPGGPKHNVEEKRWDINQHLHLHTEGGKLQLLGLDNKPTGYSIQLARVTRPSSQTEVLKLSVIDDATEENVAYAWTSPETHRVGLNLLWTRIGLTLEDQTPHLGFDPAPPVRATRRTPSLSKP